MQRDASDYIKTFEENMGVFRYPQTVVCDTVDAALTDLNEWRRRGILPKEGYVKRGRIMYTGQMLLRAGFLAELAPILGPTQASYVADLFLFESPFDAEKFTGKTAVISLFPFTRDHSGIRLVDENEPLRGIQEASVLFQIGGRVRRWMVGAELRLEDGSGA